MLPWRRYERLAVGLLSWSLLIPGQPLPAGELPAMRSVVETAPETIEARQRWEYLKQLDRRQRSLEKSPSEAVVPSPASRRHLAPELLEDLVNPMGEAVDVTRIPPTEATHTAAEPTTPHTRQSPISAIPADELPLSSLPAPWVVGQVPLDDESPVANSEAPGRSPAEPADAQPRRTIPSANAMRPLTEPTAPARLRSIVEIAPRYDLQVDAEIREYAREQAQIYALRSPATPYSPRQFPEVLMLWQAANFYHYPLYFEDPALERYGHYTPWVQPVISAARFSGQLLLLPYQMAIDPPLKPTYSLGWYRPGDVAPKLHYQIPLHLGAAAVQAGVVTGLAFLIP
ncbi:MAG: hypothetical protein KatS3mg114_0365 [Planctomycetaceae bacterium]|nr:MAG: hypothetical protein KatS3mg114_0365 [Planctomycetaceae bacterium]